VSWSPSLGISTRLACTPPREASQHHEQHPPGCLLNAHQTRIHDEEPSGAAGVGGGEARRGSVRCSGRAGVGTEEAAASERASQGSTHVVGGERVLQLGFVAGGVPEESQAAADAESPRAGAKRERDLCDIPASLSSPLLAAKRRS